jgi:hypothetical protein
VQTTLSYIANALVSTHYDDVTAAPEVWWVSSGFGLPGAVSRIRGLTTQLLRHPVPEHLVSAHPAPKSAKASVETMPMAADAAFNTHGTRCEAPEGDVAAAERGGGTHAGVMAGIPDAAAPADACLARLRCFQCFDVYALLAVLREAIAAAATAGAAAEGRDGTRAEFIGSVLHASPPAATLLGGSAGLPQRVPHQTLQADFRLWKDAGAPPGGCTAASLPGSAWSSAMAVDEPGSRHLQEQSRAPGPAEHAAEHTAASAAAAADGGDALVFLPTSNPHHPPPAAPRPRRIALLVVDSAADMLGAIASGLRNFGGHALIGQAGRLLHQVATTGSGCPVLVVNSVLPSERAGAPGAAHPQAPVEATETLLHGVPAVPVAAAPRVRAALGPAWASVPHVSVLLHGPPQTVLLHGADSAGVATGTSCGPGDALPGSAPTRSAEGRAPAAAVEDDCDEEGEGVALVMPSAVTVLKAPAGVCRTLWARAPIHVPAA